MSENSNKLNIVQVCNYLGVGPVTLNRWYNIQKKIKESGECPDMPDLPPFHRVNDTPRGAKYWYIEDLDNVDVENLSNSVLKRLFYKIHVVDMAKYSKALEKPQRGLWFDYYFLQMPYSELVDRAKEMGYPHMEELVLEVKAF